MNSFLSFSNDLYFYEIVATSGQVHYLWKSSSTGHYVIHSIRKSISIAYQHVVEFFCEGVAPPKIEVCSHFWYHLEAPVLSCFLVPRSWSFGMTLLPWVLCSRESCVSVEVQLKLQQFLPCWRGPALLEGTCGPVESKIDG